MTPLDRAERIRLIVEQWYGDEQLAGVTDLLTDIRHHCDEERASFATVDRLAHKHYLAERQEAQS